MNETAAQRMFEARTERRAKTPTGYEVILRCIALSSRKASDE